MFPNVYNPSNFASQPPSLDDYCKELNEDMGLLCTEEGDVVSVRETIGDGSQ